MSFLSGIVNFGKSALGFLGGNSTASGLLKTAALGFALNKLSSNAIKDNNSGTQNIDQGVRLQLDPSSESKIPVLYGTAYFGGNIFDARLSSDNKTMWFALALAETTGNRYSDNAATDYTFKDIYLDNQRIVFRSDGITADYSVDKQGVIDRSISGLIEVYCYAGSSQAGLIPENYTGTVPNAYDVFPEWSASTHPANDLVFALVKVDYNRDKGVTSLGDWLFQVESTLNNPGDVLFDYLTNTRYGAGIPQADIDTDSIDTLVSYSNQSVGYTDEGLGAETLANRYQINGLVDTEETVLTNAENLASAAASWLSFDIHTGQWSVVVNKAETAVADFSDDNILGNISLGGTGLTDLYNSVKVEFPHRDLRDSADFVKIEIPASDRNQNEPDNTLNITYDNINEPVQAEILGFIELKQSRVNLVIDFETDFSYLGLRAGDVISVSNPRYGFTNKLFRIVTVVEKQDDQGALTLAITALEYDADVYTLQDITRFTRTDEDGIITLGSIGQPTTPQVTKFERASRPRIEIETTTPSGIVEGLEYWITFDDEIQDDTQRNYTLIATQRPINANTFATGTQVVREYDNLDASNFLVKVRGFNQATVGPFSDPSGLIEFTPTQTTDAITPETELQDELGGLATAFGILQLLSLLDDLFGGITESGSLFSSIFDLFEQETGTDIVQQATEGSVGAIKVADDGSIVVEQAKNLDFGTGLSVTDNGSGAVTVDVDSVPQQVTQQNLANFVVFTSCPSGVTFGDDVTISFELKYEDCDKVLQIPYTITGDVTASDISVPLTGDVEVKIVDGSIITTNFQFETFDNDQPECRTLIFTIGCKSCEFEICPPVIVDPEPGDPDVCLLLRTETLPQDKNSWNIDVGLRPPLVPHTGSYFVRFEVDEFNSDEKPYVTDMDLGSGNFELYESDGTLAESVPASSCTMHGDVVEIPFADRILGTDYYLIWDQGVVTYCGCEARKLDSGTAVNFTVAPYAIAPYSLSQIAPSEYEDFEPEEPQFNPLTVSSITPGGQGEFCDPDEVVITFSETIQKQSGAIQFTDVTTGNYLGGSNVSSATLNGNSLTFSNIPSFTPEHTIQIDVEEGIAISDRQTQNLGVCGLVIQFTPENAENKPTGTRFDVAPELELIDYTLYSEPFEDEGKTQVNIRSNIELEFNKQIAIAAGSAPIEIYEDGSLAQTIDLRDTYGNDQIGEIYQIGNKTLRLNPTRIFKPGSSYYINIPANTILDPQCNTTLPAITDSETISWQTDAVEQSSSPAAYDPQQEPDPEQASIEYEIDRPVVAGSGEIEITDDQGNVLGTIPANSPAISIVS